jgi:signal transduction histidine kinase
MVETLTSKLRALPPMLSDAALAVAFTAVGFAGLAARPAFEPHGAGVPTGGLGRAQSLAPGSPTNPFGHFDSPSPVAYVLTAAAFLPLAFRQKAPYAVLAVTTIIAAVYETGHLPPNLVFIAPLIALYTVATLHDRRATLIAGALSAVVQLSAAWMTVGSAGFWTEFVRVLALLGVAAAIGDATRNRRAYVAEVEQRAADAERTREEEASRRVDEERLRIARELHDVTAHSLSIIAVQSGAASHVIDTDPAEARRALEAIRRTSKDALEELRAMLGVLRTTGEGDAPLSPVPGLARLGELLAPLVEAGYDVETQIDDELGEIPAVVEGSAYRIVQESLTNVVRHAGICRVWLTVSRAGGTLSITVDDDGATPTFPLPDGRHGLAGMRERVTALGGEFTARPREGGGFHVAATLPIVRSST